MGTGERIQTRSLCDAPEGMELEGIELVLKVQIETHF